MTKRYLSSLFLLSFFILVGLSCGTKSKPASSNGITIDLLTKNKFHFENSTEDLTISFKEPNAFTFEYSSEIINWDGGGAEGTFEIVDGKLLLHPKQCNLRGMLVDCAQSGGEAEGTLLEAANSNALAITFLGSISDNMFKKSIQFPIVDINYNACAETIKEQSNTPVEPSKLLGKWASDDGKMEFEFNENGFTSTISSDNSEGTNTVSSEGTYKISTNPLPRECFRNESVKGISNGNYINIDNQSSIFYVKYSINDDVLTLEWENGTKGVLNRK